MSESDINRVWPKWEVEGILGSGVFGKVYLVRTMVDDCAVFAAAKVIKMPPAADAITNAEKMGISTDLLSTYFGKFKNDLNWELTMFRTVNSQHLVPVDDVTMEDADGPGWTGYIRTGIYTPLSVYFDKVAATQEDAARLGSEICSALNACAEYDMIHGEIKPENVMVTDTGAFVLSDFGVRRCLEKAGTSIFGDMTSSFEAPELSEERKYTQAADIYSLGKLMCYVAGGCSLPPQGDPYAIDGIDKGIAEIIKKATAADPTARYQSAAEMGAAVSKLHLGKKPPRRAMAAAAAFDAVKKNGGIIRPATAAAAVAAAAKTVKTEIQETADIQNAAAAKAGAGVSAEEMKKAAVESGFDKEKWENTAEPEPETAKKKSKKTGIIIAVIAALAVIALALVIAKPWAAKDTPQNDITEPVDGPDDTPNGDSADQNAGTGDDTTEPDSTVDPNGDNTADPENSTNTTEDTGETDTTGGDNSTDVNIDQNATVPDDGSGDATTGNDSSSGGSSSSGSSSSGTSSSGNTGSSSSGSGSSSSGDSSSSGSTATNNSYLFPSDTKLITNADMKGMTSSETYMLLNEIYARHGKIFKTESIQSYFESQKWYTPVTTDSSAITPKFNSTESANVKTIVAYQKEMGYRATTSSSSGSSSSDSSTDKNNTYLFPSDTTLITNADMEGMTRAETYMLINEIYARHGKTFKEESIQSYFDSMEWYTPVSNDSKVIAAEFNDIEAANVKTIAAFQREMGYRS